MLRDEVPDTPPHVWNVDFPHTMLRAKAIKFLASTDTHGQFAGIPVVVQVANALNKTRFMRKQLGRALGVHPDAWLPELATSRLRWRADQAGHASVVTNGQRTPGRVAIFAHLPRPGQAGVGGADEEVR